MYRDNLIMDLALVNINRIAGPEGRREAQETFGRHGIHVGMDVLADRFSKIEHLRRILEDLREKLS